MKPPLHKDNIYVYDIWIIPRARLTEITEVCVGIRLEQPGDVAVKQLDREYQISILRDYTRAKQPLQQVHAYI